MAWTASNPAATDELTSIDDINAAFNNTLAIVDGERGIDRLVTTEANVSVTGTQNDYGLTTATVYRWAGASAVTFTSIVPTYSGQIAIFRNVSSGQTLKIADEDAAGGTTANRVICDSLAGQIVGPKGEIAIQYDATSSRWRILFVKPGDPITVAHADSNFTGGTTDANWVVEAADQVVYKYQQEGKTVRVWLTISNSTVANTPNDLRVTLPNSWVGAVAISIPCYISNAGTATIGRIFSQSLATHLQIELVPGGAFTNATNTTGVQGFCTFEIN